jgi:hypothetical protein
MRINGSSSKNNPEEEAERYPYTRIVWRPDIEKMKTLDTMRVLDTSVVKKALPAKTTHSDIELELLAIVDLLAHKNPSMNILLVDGENLVSSMLKVLNTGSIYKRYTQFTATSNTENGNERFLTQKPSNSDAQYIEIPSLIEANFDLVIVPEVCAVSPALCTVFNVELASWNLTIRKALQSPADCRWTVCGLRRISTAHRSCFPVLWHLTKY